MNIQKIIILLGFCLVVFVTICHSQNLPQITISETTKIEPFTITHLAKIADRKVTFKLLNNTKYKISIFGSYVEGELRPIRYLLRFNKKLNDWNYPTRNNRPVPWKEVSQTYKNEKILMPGESITFSSFFSSVSDCGEHYKVTVQVRMSKSKKTQEIKSDEFMIDPCK